MCQSLLITLTCGHRSTAVAFRNVVTGAIPLSALDRCKSSGVTLTPSAGSVVDRMKFDPIGRGSITIFRTQTKERVWGRGDGDGRSVGKEARGHWSLEIV